MVTVVTVLIALSLFYMATSRLTRKEKGFEEIVAAAENGREDFIIFSPEQDMDLCSFLGADLGCYSDLGVDPYCKIMKDFTYMIRAHPVPSGVCVNVTEVV